MFFVSNDQPREAGLFNVVCHAGYASANVISALACAAAACALFQKNLCVSLKDEGYFGSNYEFCLGNPQFSQLHNQVESLSQKIFGDGYLVPLLGGTSGLLSLYFAKRAYQNIKNIF